MSFLWVFIFFISLYVLVKSADTFTKQASKIGLAFGLSSFIVGATIVAMGTSLPELVASLFAVKAGTTEFVADKVVGANIANVLLILGAGVLFAKKMTISTSLIWKTIPFFVLSAILFSVFALDGVILKSESLILFIFFLIFFVFSILSKQEVEDHDELVYFKEQFKIHTGIWRYLKVFKYIGILVLSGIFLAVSANFLIESLLKLSSFFNISSSLITITIVSFGASLPEAMTSFSAIRLGNYGMAVGNILGSSVFNLLLIVGFSGLFGDLLVSSFVLETGLLFLILSMIIGVFSVFGNKLRLWEGVFMLIMYLVFLLKIVNLI